MNRIVSKVKSFCKKKKDYLMVAGIITFAMITFYAIFGLYPFGHNTIAHYDLYEQAVPLINIIYDFLGGRAALSFSFFTGGGANTFGYLSYYIFSPFTFLFFILGKANLIYTVNLMLYAKLLTIGLVFCYFLKKTFKLNLFYTVLLSILYVFSGYMFFSYTWITWLDLLIYIPLLALAFLRLKNTGKIGWFTALLCCIILNCFALGSFTLILLFIIFALYSLVVLQKNERKIVMGKVALSYAISIGLTAVVLVPSLLQYLDAARNGNGFMAILTKETLRNFPSKFTTVIADIVLVFFALFFVIKSNKKVPLNKFLSLTLLLTFLPVVIDEVNLMLNFGSYYGYCLRFGFLNLFFEAVCVALVFREQQQKKEMSAELQPQKSFRNHRLFDLSFLLTFILTIIIVAMVYLYPYLSQILSNAQSTINSMMMYLFLFLLCNLFLLSIMLSLKSGKLERKFILFFLPILVFTQVAVNSTLFLGGGVKNPSVIQELSSVTQVISHGDDARYKDYSGILSANTPSMIGANSFTAFSSLCDANLSQIGVNLGYYATDNYISSYGGTVLSDALTNNKYIISKTELQHPYLSFVSQTENYYIYENSFLFPRAFTLNDIDLEFNETDNLYDKQNKLYQFLGGTDDLMDEINLLSDLDNLDITLDNLNIAVNGGGYQFLIVDSNLDGKATFTFTTDTSTVLYLDLEYDTTYLDFTHEVNGELWKVDRPTHCIREVGYVEAGDTITLTLTTSINLKVDSFRFATVDLQKMSDLVDDINMRAVDVTYGKNTIAADFENTADDLYLFLSNTYLNGWSSSVNGNQTVAEKALMGFTATPIVSGTNAVILTYKNPYFTYAIYALIGGLILAGLLFILNLYLNKWKHVTNILSYMAFGLAQILALAFVTGPCIIAFLKLIQYI